MDPRVCLIFLIALHKTSYCTRHPHPSNGLRECRKNSSILALEVLPGGGWDNLRNRDMGRVMNFSYSQCQTTEDGLYFIPDEVFVIPQKSTVVDRISEIFEHWLNYSSSTSQTINADFSFGKVLNAKFSTESQNTKIYQVHDRSVISRSQVRNRIYTANAYPDFSLDSRVIDQVKAIADAHLHNNTRQATFLAEMMVVDYGTHVITSVDSGANIEQNDYVVSSYYYTYGRKVTSSSTGLNLFKVIKFDMDTKVTHETTQSSAYMSNLVHSQTVIHGGQSFYPGMTLKTWQESTPNNLVAIDRSGLPLHYILNSATLPDLPEITIQKVVEYVRQAIERYYEVNKRPGCVDPSSQNFNFQANIDDGSCLGTATNLHFGGIYQTCKGDKKICDVQEQKNPDTGSFSCRLPYYSTLLQSVEVQQHYTTTESYETCDDFLFFECCCETHSYETDHLIVATVETYWCASTTPTAPNTGYLFGGLYGPNVENPLTKSKACPLYFVPLKFLSSDFFVCVSNDYEQAAPYAVPFGGFASCKANNPLANSNHHCPPGFSQHLATIDDGCQILYCVKSGAFTEGQLEPIHLPPFIKPDLIMKASNKSLVMIAEGNQVWFRKGNTNSWQSVKKDDIGAYLKQLNSPSRWGTVIVGLLVTLVMIACLVGGVFMMRRWRHNHREGYAAISHTEPE